MSRIVYVGDRPLGGGHPVAIQTMWSRPLTHVSEQDLERMRFLHKLGCEFLRFAVPNRKAIAPLETLIQALPAIKIVADIHFSHSLALDAIKAGVHKVRINPGNIGETWKIREVVTAAADAGIPIRIGVNQGSLPASLEMEKDIAQAMVKAALDEVNLFEALNFRNYLVSLKSSNADLTIEANRLFHQSCDCPIHLGVTEAGPLIAGLVKSTYAVCRLLEEGIGDTIRISLSDSVENEIIAAREILNVLKRGQEGVTIVSCPRCGRASLDAEEILQELAQWLYTVKKNITVAVMGCNVNGPGEARHADIGIAGSGKQVVLFRKGEIIQKIPTSSALRVLKEEVEKL